MKHLTKFLILVIFALVTFTLNTEEVQASNHTNTTCSLTDLPNCLPQAINNYYLQFLNAPLQPLLTIIRTFLTAQVNTSIFIRIHAIVKYILSFFYIFSIIYSGYILLFQSSNPIRRNQAKEILKDTLIMIVLIQGSFYIYNLILNLSSIMNQALLTQIDPQFFLLTTDNIVNFTLQMFFSFTYVIILFITMFLLALRYMLVSFGVIFFPLALFCYFIPPLKSYGKFLLEVLFVFIFITFIDLLIILSCSLLLTIPIFTNFKIIVMINCFLLIIYTLYLAVKFALSRSVSSNLKEDISGAVKYLGMIA